MTLEHFDSVFAFVVVLAGVSLLVTTLSQMIGALLGLRGTHLAWGIRTLLSSLDPSLVQHAERISDEVLLHPLISDSTFSQRTSNSRLISWLLPRLSKVGLGHRFKLATAIRKEELVRILLLVANPPAGSAANPSGDSWRAALSGALQAGEPQVAKVLDLAAPELQKLFPGQVGKADEIMGRMMGATGDLANDVENWFESVMDRVSQRYATHMRLWTVLFSVLIAFALQLNAFKLFQQVSTDAELRTRLVASADALTRKADEILVTGTNEPAAVYVEAMKQLLAAHTNELAGLLVPGGFADRAGAESWLSNRLVAARITPTDRWMHEYDALVPGARIAVAAENLHSILNDKLKFQLIPDNYPRSASGFLASSWLNFWGIVASAALLSLGAPFWFNMLKALANLRPVLANKEDKKAKEKKQA